MKITSLTYRLIVWFIAVALLPLAIFGLLSLREYESSLRNEVLGRMSRLADKKTLQIKTYLAERVQDMELMARNNLVQDGVGELSRVLAVFSMDSPQYKAVEKPYRDILSVYINTADDTRQFYDVFLINPQGKIVFTYKHESDMGTNLNSGPFRNTQLASVYRESFMSMDSSVSDFEYYKPSSAPAAFIAAPIVRDGVLLGVFAFQLDTRRIFQVALDNMGLGLTGETVLGKLNNQDEAIFVAPLRRFPDAAMKQKADLRATAYPMKNALAGKRGGGVDIDYAKIPVVAAWRYLPELHLGMVVKMDVKEAFAPIYQQRKNLIEALLAFLILGALAAFYFGRQIVLRIHHVAFVADEIALGDMSKRVDDFSLDEIGRLGRAFNRMTDKLESSYRNLEERINERTRDLNVSNEQLQEEIYERQHIENALRDSQQFFETLSSVNPVGIFRTDDLGQYKYVNQRWCEISGLNEDDALANRWIKIVHKDDVQKVQREWETGIREARLLHLEFRIQNSNGNNIWVDVQTAPIKNDKGETSGYVGTLTDITERKQAEEVLLRNKKILDLTRDGFWLVDQNGNILDANAAYANMTGYSVEELKKMHVSQLEAVEKSVEDVRNHISKIIQSGGGQFETRHLHKDGHEIDMDISTVFLPEIGQIAAFMRNITERKRFQQELQRNQDLLNEAQSLGHLGSWELDLLTGELRWSDEIYKLFELDPKGFKPTYENFLSVIHPADRDRVNEAYKKSLENRQPYDIVHRLEFEDGRVKWVNEHCTSYFDESGKAFRSIGAVLDITAQKQAEENLRIAAVTFETHEGIMITDVNANIIRVNKAFSDITGFGPEDVIGKNPRILSSGRHDKSFYTDMWNQLLTKGGWTGEVWDRRKSGQIYPKWLTISAVKNDQGETTEFVAIFSDITARKQAEDEIRNLAFYDALTALPNRRLFLDRFRLALSVSERSGYFGAVLFLDMDRFKTLNDTLGHDFGDLLLIEVAQRIRSCIREVDTVARFGGDEFVVLIEEIDTNAEHASQKVALIAEKIRTDLTAPYMLKEQDYHSSPSVGVCLYLGNTDSVDELLRRADMAMYQAKESGRNAIRFFDPVMQLAVETRALLENDLRRAISDSQLRLFYQVQVDKNYKPVGAEALVRWIHPVRGFVSPADFIPVAEESSLILDIGHWVLDNACHQLALWGKSEKTRDLVMAVNVSAKQLHLDDFVDRVAAVIHAHQVNPSFLKLELTESMIMSQVTNVIEKMHDLRALGVKLSMDDFGTGYSSLSNLKQLPLDQLKIDQSFVRDLVTDPNDAVMVQTIINMAQNFKLDIIAEGVESIEQLDFLKKHGCFQYQGFLFSKPVPVEDIESVLDEVSEKSLNF